MNSAPSTDPPIGKCGIGTLTSSATTNRLGLSDFVARLRFTGGGSPYRGIAALRGMFAPTVWRSLPRRSPLDCLIAVEVEGHRPPARGKLASPSITTTLPSRMEARITINPAVCNGRPIVRGTRITVQTILEFLAAGDSIEDVIDGYPELSRDDVMACLRFSSQVMSGNISVEHVA